jgi:hypothetical protein
MWAERLIDMRVIVCEMAVIGREETITVWPTARVMQEPTSTKFSNKIKAPFVS